MLPALALALALLLQLALDKKWSGALCWPLLADPKQPPLARKWSPERELFEWEGLALVQRAARAGSAIRLRLAGS